MTTHRAKYDFAGDLVPSLALARDKVAQDPNFPRGRRASTLSSLARLAKWSGQDASAIAFVEPVIEALFDRLRSDVLGISAKRLANARSDVRYVLEQYGGAKRYLAPFTPEAQCLWSMLTEKYDQCSLSRLLRYLSAKRIDPVCMSEATSRAFLDALRHEGRLKRKPEIFHQSTIRAWNKAVVKYPSWPQITLEVPRYKTTWTLPWSALPPSLGAEVDAFLAGGAAGSASLFDEKAPPKPLKATTASTQKDHIRCAASALVHAGQPAASLTGIKQVCGPTSFRLALETMINMRGGRIGGYMEGLAWTLVKLARYGDALQHQEIDLVNRFYKRLATKRGVECRTDVDRDDALLGQLDDPRVLDALLTLPTRTVERVLKSRERTRALALEVQKACALELWLCAPLRLSNFVSLRLDRHFHRLTLDGAQRVVVRIPAVEVKNEEPLEHFLSLDAANLLELYVQEFRPLLVEGASPWLFPGYGGKHKVDAALSAQMKKFVNAATGIDFHPHLIRKITTKLYLDADPGGIEVARRCLGHRDVRTTRRAYTQQQQRAAQLRYLEMLESRRLLAIGQCIDADPSR